MPRLTLDQACQIAMRHHEAGRLSEAEPIYRQILTYQPGHPDALHMLGLLAHQLGRSEEGAELIRRGIAASPRTAQFHNTLGIVLRVQGRLDEAADAFRHAVALQADFPEPWYNLSTILKDTGQIDESIACIRQSLALRPRADFASRLLLLLHFHPDYGPVRLRDEHVRWSETYARPVIPSAVKYENDSNPDRRLRVGYISPDLRSHPIGRLMVPILAHHDREQFEIFCYADVPQPDEITARLVPNANVWRNTSGLPDENLAQLVRQDRIDLLIDLALHTEANRLLAFARKPAPVQVTWLGYPGTSGLATMDYRLSDPYLDPPRIDESPYTEKTLRLPDSFWCFDQLTDLPPVGALPAQDAGTITFGCLNSPSKANDRVLDLWARVLGAVLRSRMILLTPEGSAREWVAHTLTQQGVDPARIEFTAFMPRQDYLQLYHRIDVSLDTFPYSGHTTTFDSLWMGVPVVSLAGQTAVSRGSQSILSNAGLSHLIAHTPEQYVRIATDLAEDLPRLSYLRATLRDCLQASPLMDAPRFVRGLEAAYRHMWKTWCGEVSAGCKVQSAK